MAKSVSIRVSGKVQGVFYRASTKDKAEELNIKGFVRNEPDGTVYIEAEGEEENLERFITWCRQGPPLANVKDCQVNTIDKKNFTSFSIQRE